MSTKITRYKLRDPIREDLTDWARIDSMTEEELERAIAADPDADLEVDWTKARIVLPPKQPIHLRVDPDVLDWFRQQGPGYSPASTPCCVPTTKRTVGALDGMPQGRQAAQRAGARDAARSVRGEDIRLTDIT